MKFHAQQLVSLLQSKHKDDLFITECKMGQAGSRILDALAIKRTWSPRTVIGYEIKVDRSDFLNDTKWPEYQKICTHFYFVCPSKLIQPEELPAGVGLMWVSTTGTRLFTKRKATYHKQNLDADTLLYILMTRAKITPSNFGKKVKDKKQFWQEWLKTKQMNAEFGYMVSTEFGKRFRQEVTEVQWQNATLKKENEDLQEIKALIEDSGHSPRSIKNFLTDTKEEVINNLFPEVKWSIQRLKKNLEEVDQFINLQTKKAGKAASEPSNFQKINNHG